MHTPGVLYDRGGKVQGGLGEFTIDGVPFASSRLSFQCVRPASSGGRGVAGKQRLAAGTRGWCWPAAWPDDGRAVERRQAQLSPRRRGGAKPAEGLEERAAVERRRGPQMIQAAARRHRSDCSALGRPPIRAAPAQCRHGQRGAAKSRKHKEWQFNFWYG